MGCFDLFVFGYDVHLKMFNKPKVLKHISFFTMYLHIFNNIYGGCPNIWACGYAYFGCVMDTWKHNLLPIHAQNVHNQGPTCVWPTTRCVSTSENTLILFLFFLAGVRNFVSVRNNSGINQFF